MKDEQLQPPKEIWSIDDVMQRALPCPFCGEKPIAQSEYAPSEVEISCVNNECEIRPSLYESVTCIENAGDSITYTPMFGWHWKTICDKWNTRHGA